MFDIYQTQVSVLILSLKNHLLFSLKESALLLNTNELYNNKYPAVDMCRSYHEIRLYVFDKITCPC